MLRAPRSTPTRPTGHVRAIDALTTSSTARQEAQEKARPPCEEVIKARLLLTWGSRRVR